MKTLFNISLILGLSFPGLAQTSTPQASFEWSGPCEIAGVMETCRIKIPIKIDPLTRTGTLDLTPASIPGLDTAVSAILPGLLPAAVNPLVTIAIDSQIPAIAAKVAPLIPQPPPVAVVSGLPCPGPFLARESSQVLVIGAAWTQATPCRIPQAGRPPFFTTITEEIRLTQPVRIQVPVTASCRGWVWVDRGAVRYSSYPDTACRIPGALGEVPSFGAYVLGYWVSDKGDISITHSSIVPELVHDSWTVQLRAQFQANGLSAPRITAGGTGGLFRPITAPDGSTSVLR
jgi:hypothetical protein